MTKKRKNKKTIGTTEDLIKAFRKASREAELERNGGRWVAKDRPHKNKKAYNRKRDRQIDVPFFLYLKTDFPFVSFLRFQARPLSQLNY